MVPPQICSCRCYFFDAYARLSDYFDMRCVIFANAARHAVRLCVPRHTLLFRLFRFAGCRQRFMRDDYLPLRHTLAAAATCRHYYAMPCCRQAMLMRITCCCHFRRLRR